jgi:hypothetical protein
MGCRKRLRSGNLVVEGFRISYMVDRIDFFSNTFVAHLADTRRERPAIT